MVTIFAFKLVVGASKLIEALFIPLMLPLTAIVPLVWGDRNVTGKSKVTALGSEIAIVPLPSARPIIICENPLKAASSVVLRFTSAELPAVPTVIPKLGVRGCRRIVPLPLT